MSSAVFTCTVQQDPCPQQAQQRLDFVGFSVGPDCYGIFVLMFVSTVLLNMFAWKVGMALTTVRKMTLGRR